MLPFIYPDLDARVLLEDIEGADIPDVHKAMFAWVKDFTCDSANLSAGRISDLMKLGIPAKDVVEWANVASIQTWFVMSADGGGIPLEGNTVMGSVIGLERENYHKREVATVNCGAVAQPTVEDEFWVPADTSALSGITTALGAYYGFVPNLFKANSLAPQYFPRHELGLKLLEQPKSGSLDARLHAMVRRWVNVLNQGRYLDQTTQQLLVRHDQKMLETLEPGADLEALEPRDRAVLKFADKLTRNAYKVTASDAQSFRDHGLDDEAYVDVINTVSIQTSLDRLSNALGVVADERVLLRQIF